MTILPVRPGTNSSFQFTWKPSVILNDKVIFIFGGAGNLAETFAYAASACGATIALADFPPADSAKRITFEEHTQEIARNIQHISGIPPLVIQADITDITDVLAAAEAVKKEFKKIDIAVDFAGMHHPSFDLVEEDPHQLFDRFRRVIDLNLNGAFGFTVAMARIMVPQRFGHIIHLCSNASRLALYGSYGYNASKHGVEGLVKTAAAQLAPYGVRVNGLAPGTVVTDLNRSLSFAEDGTYKPRAKSILAHTPTKRFLTREGVAETLLSMCIPQRHLTGNLIFPDDGYNVEGHSWPEGNEALYQGPEALEDLFADINRRYPPE